MNNNVTSFPISGTPFINTPFSTNNNTAFNINALMLPILEYVCGEIQIRFYYRHGDYVRVDELLRILAKCTSTPDVLLRKLIENGVVKPTTKPDVVEVS